MDSLKEKSGAEIAPQWSHFHVQDGPLLGTDLIPPNMIIMKKWLHLKERAPKSSLGSHFGSNLFQCYSRFAPVGLRSIHSQ